MKRAATILLSLALGACAYISGPCEAGNGAAKCATGGQLILWGPRS